MISIDNKSLKPIFIQVKEWIENEILDDRILPNEKVMSQNELAKFFNINPMTALKGISALEAKGILVKKRGIGMFVTENAKEIIYNSRIMVTLDEILDELIAEADILKLPADQVIQMVKERFDNKSDLNHEE